MTEYVEKRLARFEETAQRVRARFPFISADMHQEVEDTFRADILNGPQTEDEARRLIKEMELKNEQA